MSRIVDVAVERVRPMMAAAYAADPDEFARRLLVGVLKWDLGILAAGLAVGMVLGFVAGVTR